MQGSIRSLDRSALWDDAGAVDCWRQHILFASLSVCVAVPVIKALGHIGDSDSLAYKKHRGSFASSLI